jgi:hypothetical protein
MGIFARRVISRCLDETASFVSKQTLRDWIQRLDTVSDSYVATEWEIVLIRTLARLGKVQHEPPLGPRLMDVVFESPDSTLRFAAEITAISDEGLHRKNPIDRFEAELAQRISQAKITTGTFILEVQEDQPVPHRGTGRQRRLSLPPVDQFSNVIFDAAFDEYIANIQRDPTQPRGHHVDRHSPRVAVTIHYRPGAGHGIGRASHGTYTTTTVADDNPLYNALKEKNSKLKKSGYSGLQGIIVCDGGSRIFNELRNWAAFSMDEVVWEFLRHRKSTSFVITLGIKTPLNRTSVRHHVEPRLYIRGPDRQSEWAKALDALVLRVVEDLPEIQQTPENSINHMKWNRSTLETKPYYGGWMMHGDKIKISARELLDLLSGKLDQKHFLRRHSLDDAQSIFSRRQAAGKMIKSVSIESLPDEDDDWVVFDLSSNDPAVNKFSVSKSVTDAEPRTT